MGSNVFLMNISRWYRNVEWWNDFKWNSQFHFDFAAHQTCCCLVKPNAILGVLNCLIACMKNWPRCCVSFMCLFRCGFLMQCIFGIQLDDDASSTITACVCVKKDSCANYKIDGHSLANDGNSSSNSNSDGNGNAFVIASRNKPSAKFQVYALIPKILLHYRSAIKIQSTKLWSTFV